jgi:hypothetical protein
MVKTITTTLAVLMLASSAGHADTLLLDGIEMDAQSKSARPRAGMSMSAVEATYGAPSDRRSAVGEPPITRWDYPQFSVYFEHDLVIHAVVRRAR